MYCYSFWVHNQCKRVTFDINNLCMENNHLIMGSYLMWQAISFLQCFGCTSAKLLFTFWYRFVLGHSNIGNLLWTMSILNVQIHLEWTASCDIGHSKYIMASLFLSFLLVLLSISNIVVIIHLHLFFSLNLLGLDWHI